MAGGDIAHYIGDADKGRDAACRVFTDGFHTPVLLEEALDFLDVQPGEKYIDATVGGGGHTAVILEKRGIVLGIDQDSAAVEAAQKKLAAEFPAPNIKYQILNTRYRIVQGNFKNVDEIAEDHGSDEVRGVLYDLGMSSWQLENSGRGFSFLKDEPLDMRMDPALSVKAEDLLNGLTEKELDELFSKFAQEKRSRAIARACVGARNIRPIKTTQELSGLLAWVELGERGDFWDWYTGTFSKDPDRFGNYDRRARIFQALRTVVNDELNNLKISLPRAARLLKPLGRLVVISFHSLEDAVVKGFGKDGRPSYAKASEGKPLMKSLTKKPVRPSVEEIRENPRARSARLRAFERTR